VCGRALVFFFSARARLTHVFFSLHLSLLLQVPEEVTAYFLQQAGVTVTDPRMYVWVILPRAACVC
jgi:hypothetical protein